MSRKLRTIIILGALFVILAALYFAVIAPWYKAKTETPEEEPPELLPGEVLGTNNRILLFEHVEKADMLSIEVHNEFGTYTFYRGSDDNFHIKDMESVSYSLEGLSNLVVSTGYTLSMRRLDFAELDDDFSVYGLGENDNPAWYVITKMDGTTHKVLVGSLIPTGGGYYSMYEGRRAVYVLDTSFATSVLADIHTLINPLLGYPVSSTSYYNLDDFYIFRNGEPFVAIDMKTAEETGNENGMPSFVMVLPVGYDLKLTTYSAFMEKLASFQGDACVAAGYELDGADEDLLLEKYNIDLTSPWYLLHYKLDDVETIIVFSEPDEDGNMYAFSSVYDLIARINVSNASFVNWGLLEFVDDYVFYKNINDVARIEIKGKLNELDSKGNPIDVDAFFTLDGEKETIIVRPNGQGDGYDADDLKNFRQLYKVMLGIKLYDYADEGYEKNMKEIMSMKVTMDSGEELEYVFYAYSSRRCYYTVNGRGEFYCLREAVEKLIRNTNRMLIGDQIISDNDN